VKPFSESTIAFCFSFMTPNRLQTASSGSASSSNGNSIFCLKRSCEASESREMPNTSQLARLNAG
jgi:hypothetical protein